MQKCFITSLLLFGIFLNAGFAQINRPNAPKNENTEQLTAQVVNAISENNLNEATTILQKLLISQPRNVAVQTLAGITADRQNDLIAAEKYFANEDSLDISTLVVNHDLDFFNHLNFLNDLKDAIVFNQRQELKKKLQLAVVLNEFDLPESRKQYSDNWQILRNTDLDKLPFRFIFFRNNDSQQ